jgi:hypothetical protein
MEVHSTIAESGDPVIYITGVTNKDVAVVRTLYGMQQHKEDKDIWFAPGMLPFGKFVLEDIEECKYICYFKLMPSTEALKSFLDTNIANIQQKSLDGYVPKIKPYAHQIEALSLAIHMPRLGLFLDPGLGKTKIGCDLIQHTLKTRKCFWLIVALKVNQFTWEKEMLFHSKEEFTLTPITKSGKARRKDIVTALSNSSCVGLVVTYDTCRVAKDLLLELIPFTDVILDESHSLRSPRSGKTKAVLEMLSSKPLRRRVLLSGTPSLGSPMHLWGQLKALGQFIVPNSYAFENTYACRSPFNRHIIVGWKNLDQINDLVTSISIRRTADECLDLPDRTIQVVEIEPSNKTKKVYNQVASHEATIVDGLEFSAPDNPLVSMTRLAQLSMGFIYKSRKDPTICDLCPKVRGCVEEGIQPYTSRCTIVPNNPGRDIGLVGTLEVLDAVVELVESHTEAGKKVILWAKHRWVLDTLADKLSKLTTVFRYDSTTKSHAQVEEGFNLAKSGVIVAQISMGIGVTFKAPVMVYAELSWSLDHWLQSLDRNYGIRAEGFKSLLVQSVVIKGSISHSVIKLLQSKIDVSSMMSKTVECVSCPRVGACLSEGVEPFDIKCILPAETGKSKLSISTL